MKELEGKVIRELWINQDQSILKFVTDAGDLYYYAEGDCCSETWFADICLGYHPFNGEPVSSVEELEVPEWLNDFITKDGRTRQEFDQVYGYRINQKGYGRHAFDIIYRNSSNGYYGGSCHLMNPTKSTWEANALAESEWEQITNDWKA